MTPEERKAYMKKWREDHPDYEKNRRKKRRAYMKAYKRTERCRAKNREYLKSEAGQASVKKSKAKVAGYLQDLKMTTPCSDCGGFFHYSAMQFDHLPGHDKDFMLSQHRDKSMADVKREVSKCDVVCANCHAVRSWLRSKNRG